MSNFVPKEIVKQAKQIDLLTYFMNNNPSELVKKGTGTYNNTTIYVKIRFLVLASNEFVHTKLTCFKFYLMGLAPIPIYKIE